MPLNPAELAAFRMRCWFEMSDTKLPHFASAYHQLVEDADTMCNQILLHLMKKGKSFGRNYEDSVNTEAELLITALVGEFFCRPLSSHRFTCLISQARTLIHRLTNQQLLSYVLVLLFYYDENPAKGMMSQINGMMKMIPAGEMTPEDKHIRNLYKSKLEQLRYEKRS